MSHDLQDAYATAVQSRPRKRRPVRIKLSVPRATQLRNALDHLLTSANPPHLPNTEARAIVEALAGALSSVLPPQLITPAGPSK